MLLQILDDGILTDSQGRRVDFKNTIIIMTSNLGAKLIAGENKAIGFGSQGNHGERQQKIHSAVMNELKKTFRPEFLNRIDEVIVFNQLSKDEIYKIAQRMLDTTRKRLEGLDIEMSFDESVIKAISDAGFDPVYGARPLRRAIQSKIEDRLSEQMLEGKITAGKKYLCSMREGEVEFTQLQSAER